MREIGGGLEGLEISVEWMGWDWMRCGGTGWGWDRREFRDKDDLFTEELQFPNYIMPVGADE